MANDWIKMRGDLVDNPKVFHMARELRSNPMFREWLTPGLGGEPSVVSDSALRRVTCALLCVTWSWSRAHGKQRDDDCHLMHICVDEIDAIAGAPGVGKAMEAVGWAINDTAGHGGVILPNFFAEHNVPLTKAQKQRAYRARKARYQSVTQNVTETLPRDGNKPVTREEKRRDIVDESTHLLPQRQKALRIYHAYPRKVGKAAAVRAIEKSLDDLTKRGTPDPAEWLLEKTKTFAKSPAGNRGSYTPHPATWFNQARYDDDPSEWNKSESRGPAPRPADRFDDNEKFIRCLQPPTDGPDPGKPSQGVA